MDNYSIRLIGKAELSEPLTISHNFRVKLEGSITAETISDNDDGSRTHYYTFKPVIVETIDQTGKTLKAKDTRSISQRMRARCYLWWREHMDRNKTQEEVYEWFGERAIQSFDPIMDLLENEYGKIE